MNRTGMLMAILLGLCLGGGAATGPVQAGYQVTVDTSTLFGQVGNLDLQFNPGGADTLAAIVMIRNFLTDGTLAAASTNTGGASGTLPGPPEVSLDNSAGFNDLFQGITFGHTLSFDADFAGPALSPAWPLPLSGSTFALSLYDAAGTTPLLSSAPDGSLLHIDLSPEGRLSAETFADESGAFHATVTSGVVPEPGSLLVLGTGMLGLLPFLRRRR